MNIRTPLGRLRIIGVAEGASFLLLLGIAMPLKYMAGMPQYVSVVGAVHGLLWLAYVAAVAEVKFTVGWSWRMVLLAMVASVLPFGPFVLDARLREEQLAVQASRQVA
jgi:integral membrane protein